MDNATHYLTRLRYRLSDRELARKLRTCYEQHRTLWTLFDDQAEQAITPATQLRNFLFRQNREPALAKLGLGEFILLSDRKPKPVASFNADVKSYRPKLAVGDRLHFLLRAEVLASKALPGKGLRGKKHDPMLSALQAAEVSERSALRTRWLLGEFDGDQIKTGLLISDWLAPKMQRLGFELELSSCRAESHETVQCKREKQQICFSEADFQGQMRVTDTALASQAALRGVGHSKAFGCGLLLLRRAESDVLDD